LCCGVVASQFGDDLDGANRNNRIFGGVVARAHQFPHIVALTVTMTSGSSFCGGSIVSQNYVLTAAHCLDNLARLVVQAGIHDISRGVPQYRAMVERRDTRQHPQYNTKTLVHDIALIHLLTPLTFSIAVQRIALPTRAQANNHFVGQTATVIGWGLFSDGELLLLVSCTTDKITNLLLLQITQHCRTSCAPLSCLLH